MCVGGEGWGRDRCVEGCISGDLAVVEGQRNGKFSQNGKLHVGHSCARVMKGRPSKSQIREYVVHLGINVYKQLRP